MLAETLRSEADSLVIDKGDTMTREVYAIARKYNIKLDWFSEGALTYEERKVRIYPKDFSWGPVGEDCGFSMKERYVYGCGCGVAHIFHELVHILLGAPGLKFCEGFALMPFEWKLAHHVARKMSKGDGSFFISEVNEYQCCTMVSRYPRKRGNHEDWCLEPDDRDVPWWQYGIQNAQRLGLLTQQNHPTYKDATWTPRLMRRARTWATESAALARF